MSQQQYVYTADMLNRASLVENGVTTNYAQPSGLNQYTNVGGTQIQYDPNFNLSAFGTATASYNAMNQLVAVANNNGTAQFVYDGLGRCVKRTVAGQTLLFTYDEWNPIVEWDSAGNWKAWTIYGARTDEVLLRNSATAGLLIYKQDNQGSVTFVLNGPTNIADQYSYDAFGRPTIMDGNGSVRPSGTSVGNRFLYTGREWIAEVGLYDYRHRFYFPLIGRFLQTDPTGFDAGDMNLFRYCEDDAVNRTDPMGLYAVKGFDEDRTKKIQEAQEKAADKIGKGADAIEYGIASGKDSDAFKMVKRDFESVFHKPITVADMKKYAKDARAMVTALRDDGSKGYVILAATQQQFAKAGLPNHVGSGKLNGKVIFINIDRAFKPESELGVPLSWVVGHEAAHNAGISGDTYKNDFDYRMLSSREALDNADNYMEFAHMKR